MNSVAAWRARALSARGQKKAPFETLNLTRREPMSKARFLKVGLIIPAALLMLSACASSNDLAALDKRVSALESQTSAAEAKAAAAQTAANQCTATCQDVQAKAEQMSRMYQQSLRK
jgi:hypothetical protein